MEANGPAAEDDDRVEVGEAGQGLEHTRAPDEPADADAGAEGGGRSASPPSRTPTAIAVVQFFQAVDSLQALPAVEGLETLAIPPEALELAQLLQAHEPSGSDWNATLLRDLQLGGRPLSIASVTAMTTAILKLVENHHRATVKLIQSIRMQAANGGGGAPSPSGRSEESAHVSAAGGGASAGGGAADAERQSVGVADTFAFNTQALTTAEQSDLSKLSESASPEGIAAAHAYLKAVYAHDKEEMRKALADLCAACQVNLTLLGLPDSVLRGTLCDAIGKGIISLGQGQIIGGASPVAGEARREIILMAPAGGGAAARQEHPAESNRLELPRALETVETECRDLVMSSILEGTDVGLPKSFLTGTTRIYSINATTLKMAKLLRVAQRRIVNNMQKALDLFTPATPGGADIQEILALKQRYTDALKAHDYVEYERDTAKVSSAAYLLCRVDTHLCIGYNFLADIRYILRDRFGGAEIFKIAAYLLQLVINKGSFYRAEYERMQLIQKSAASIQVSSAVIDLRLFGLSAKDVSFDVTSPSLMNALFIIQIERHMKQAEGVKHDVAELISKDLVRRALQPPGLANAEVDRLINKLVENNFSVAGESILESVDGDGAGSILQLQAFFAGAGNGKGKGKGTAPQRGRSVTKAPSGRGAGGSALANGGAASAASAAGGGGGASGGQRSSSLAPGLTPTDEIYGIAVQLAGNKLQNLGLLGDRFNSLMQKHMATTDYFFNVGADKKALVPLQPNTAIWAQGWKHFFNPRLRRDIFILWEFLKDVCQFSPRLSSSGIKYKERKNQSWVSISTAAIFAQNYQAPAANAAPNRLPATGEVQVDAGAAKVKAFCL